MGHYLETRESQHIGILGEPQCRATKSGRIVVLAEVINRSDQLVAGCKVYLAAKGELANLVGLNQIGIGTLQPGESRPVRLVIGDTFAPVAYLLLQVAETAGRPVSVYCPPVAPETWQTSRRFRAELSPLDRLVPISWQHSAVFDVGRTLLAWREDEATVTVTAEPINHSAHLLVDVLYQVIGYDHAGRLTAHAEVGPWLFHSGQSRILRTVLRPLDGPIATVTLSSDWKSIATEELATQAP